MAFRDRRFYGCIFDGWSFGWPDDDDLYPMFRCSDCPICNPWVHLHDYQDFSDCGRLRQFPHTCYRCGHYH